LILGDTAIRAIGWRRRRRRSPKFGELSAMAIVGESLARAVLKGQRKRKAVRRLRDIYTLI
jgi:hypothetical protein